MLGASDIQSVLGAAPPGDAEIARLRSFARSATGIGLALMLIAPGTKLPVDMRSQVRKNREDKAAQEAAKAAGRIDWHKARSKAGSYLATTDAKLITDYMDQYRKTWPTEPMNFAIEVGRSGRVIVDADTAEQVTAFLAEYGAPADLPPTVRTPGTTDAATGEWAHKDGGHFYFTVPEGFTLPENIGSFTHPSGFVMYWRDRYLLIPPSVRAEGPYTQAGREHPLSPKMQADIMSASAQRATVQAQRAERSDDDMTAAVDAWAETVTWADLLAPLEWTVTGRPDSCGCDVWTAPGLHSSPKSATAHDNGCQLNRYTVANAPLHIWTDNPGPPFEEWIAAKGSKTLSKLQVSAVVSYGGDVGTACAELGVIPGKASLSDLGIVPGGGIKEDSGVVKGAVSEEITLPPEPSPSQPNVEVDPPLVVHTQESPAPLPPVEPQHVPIQAEGFAAPINPEHIGAAAALGAVVEQLADQQSTGQPQGGTVEFSGPGGTHTVPYNADGAQMHEAWSAAATGGTAFNPDDGPAPADDEPNPFSQEVTDPPDPVDPDMLSSSDNSVPKIAPFDHWRDMPPPDYAVDGLIENRALSCIVGPANVGKSTVAIDLACCLVTGKRWQGRKVIRQRVLYLPGEGLSGAVQRIKAWEDAHGMNVGQDLLLGDKIIQLNAHKDAWSSVAGYVLRARVGMIIFDTFARMSLGVEENSATEMGAAVRRFDSIRELTGAGVIVIHHTGKVGTSGRGSNALNGALESELLLTPGEWDASSLSHEHRPIDMIVQKQKNAAKSNEAIPLLLTPHGESVIVTGPSGVPGDALDSVSTVAPMLLQEPVIETAVRLRRHADRFTAQGVTRAELVRDVQPDDWTASRRNSDLLWKRAVAEAVDLALRLELLQTLTGTASGSRYVPGVMGIEAARKARAAEVMED